MKRTGKNPYHVTGISFPNPKLLAAAKERAKEFGISLSNYICNLVKNDLDDKSHVVRARPITPPASGDLLLNEPAAPYAVPVNADRRSINSAATPHQQMDQLLRKAVREVETASAEAPLPSAAVSAPKKPRRPR